MERLLDWMVQLECLLDRIGSQFGMIVLSLGVNHMYITSQKNSMYPRLATVFSFQIE